MINIICDLDIGSMIKIKLGLEWEIYPMIEWGIISQVDSIDISLIW